MLHTETRAACSENYKNTELQSVSWVYDFGVLINRQP
jgi:hypothetical protein